MNLAYGQSSVYEDIHIHVKLHEDGSAHFVERWRADLYEGTENYIVKENLGKSTIENFTVTEGGETYEFINRWNIDASREEKAFKNGIISTGKGVELSWGIGEYGSHEYVLEYTVTNIVKQLDDSQILFWTFSNEGINVPRSNITIEIESYKELSEQDEKIWAFGYPGDVEFVQGNIVATTHSELSMNDYVVLLVQFEDGTFIANDRLNKTIEEIQEEAFAGSDYDLEKGTGIFSLIWGFIKSAFSVLSFVIIMGALYFLSKMENRGKVTLESPRKFRRKYKEEYYRDYPYEGNYLHAYYITYMMGVSNFNTLLTSILLKWISEDRIQMTESTSGLFRRTYQTIKIVDDAVDPHTAEGELFRMIRNRTNKDGEITDRDIAKWAERNYRKLQAWERSIIHESARVLKDENKIEQYEKKVLFFTNKHYRLTESGKEIEGNVYKYVNYLHDYSLLHEHEAVNVKLWDEMMIWASYLNLTSVVMKQFAKIYPNYVEETKFKEDTLRRTSYMAATVARSRSKAARAAQKRRSSGGGGTASRGGGGGSFGGGRGGGIR